MVPERSERLLEALRGHPPVVGRLDRQEWLPLIDAGEVWRLRISPDGP